MASAQHARAAQTWRASSDRVAWAISLGMTTPNLNVHVRCTMDWLSVHQNLIAFTGARITSLWLSRRDCKMCAEGQYTEDGFECRDCPSVSVCEGGTLKECPAGMFGLYFHYHCRRQHIALKCVTHFFFPSGSQNAGYFCVGGAAYPCSKGSYCGVGSSKDGQCSIDLFQPSNLLSLSIARGFACRRLRRRVLLQQAR